MYANIELKLGVRTALKDGYFIYNSPKHISSESYYAKKGDLIILNSVDYVFAVGTYQFERDPIFKNDYEYPNDSIWMKYNEDLKPEDYSNEPYCFVDECFYKICFKRIDDVDVTDKDITSITKALEFKSEPVFQFDRLENIMPYFKQEAEKTIKEYNYIVKNSDEYLSLILVTDTHNMVNSAWRESQANIEYIAKRINLDGIIHLGDLTDGIVSKERTLAYAREVIDGLHIDDIPFHMVLGNHDANYFYRNMDVMSISEQAQEYMNRHKPYYSIDIKNTRLIFLHSYDIDNPVRYGFLDEEVIWLEKLLNKTNPETDVIVFSHDAPLPELDYWTDSIYNGEAVIDLLENYNKNSNGGILSFIHGHTHADFIYRKNSFPIVSIGCNKCEGFTNFKPNGVTTEMREFGNTTQDLWDILVVNKKTNEMKLIRFGAGENRKIR